MSTQVEASASVYDVVKQVFSILFVVAGVAAFYYFAEFPLIYRVLGLVVVILLVLGLMLTTEVGRNIWGICFGI
jgi:preprotein translocase subunit SecE